MKSAPTILDELITASAALQRAYVAAVDAGNVELAEQIRSSATSVSDAVGKLVRGFRSPEVEIVS